MLNLLFFCEREAILKYGTGQLSFYNQNPKQKENYKGVPKTPVHLPQSHGPTGQKHKLRSANTWSRIEAAASQSSIIRPHSMVGLQKPPPQTSHQDGFEPLKDHQRSDRRRRRRSSLQQMARQAAGDKDGATSSETKKEPTRKSAASDSATSPEEGARGGAQKVLPQRKKEDQY